MNPEAFSMNRSPGVSGVLGVCFVTPLATRLLVLFVLAVVLLPSRAAETPGARPTLLFTNDTSRLVIDAAGGSIGEFSLSGHGINPLGWGTPAGGDLAVRGFGHFLCLDRWGAPSEAEGAKGMPYHGEAANVAWSVLQVPRFRDGAIEGEMSARLPMAGLSIRRSIRLSPRSSWFVVRESIRNENLLGRMFNAVQHPTIAPPFLGADTLVDCNGRRGFAQGGQLPFPEEPSSFWPLGLNRDGQPSDLRRLRSDPNPNVVSMVIDEEFGWVTASSPRHGLLIGYVWRTRDYPWVSLWRDARDGKPSARGLEFGTTGLHQPFPILARKGRIWDRALFEYLDAGQTVEKSYAAFLCRIPSDFSGVGSLTITKEELILQERREDASRRIVLGLEGVLLP